MKSKKLEPLLCLCCVRFRVCVVAPVHDRKRQKEIMILWTSNTIKTSEDTLHWNITTSKYGLNKRDTKVLVGQLTNFKRNGANFLTVTVEELHALPSTFLRKVCTCHLATVQLNLFSLVFTFCFIAMSTPFALLNWMYLSEWFLCRLSHWSVFYTCLRIACALIKLVLHHSKETCY